MSEATQKTIEFELVSPAEKLVSEPVRLAVIPGEEGMMGVGADHAPYIIALKAGVVELYKNGLDDTPKKIFIAGGFADVTASNCTVLAEQAVSVEDLNADELAQEISNLKEDVAAAVEEIDKIRLSRYLSLAEAKLAALQ